MPLKPDPQRPIGLMLSGGGARGAFQVGVWKVLRDHPKALGREPLVISGTSAGALNGSLIAAGCAPEEMLDFWLELAHTPPVKANREFFRGLRRAVSRAAVKEPLRGFSRRRREARILLDLFRKKRANPFSQSGALSLILQFLLTARFDTLSQMLSDIQTDHLFDTSSVKDALARRIGGRVLRSSHVRLALNTVDSKTGSVIRIVNHEPAKATPQSAAHYYYEPEITLDMIVASASIPLLFNPVETLGMRLWDGGLLVNSPMAPAVALGARRIIPVLVTVGPDGGKVAQETFGDAVERLVDTFLENAYNVDRKLLLTRNEVAHHSPDEGLQVVDLYMPIRPQSTVLFDAGSYLYFQRDALISMYRAGQRAARRWLARGPLFDDRMRAV